MITNQVMKREMGEFTILQRTKDGYFCASDLIHQWNEAHPTEKKIITDFLRLDETQDLILTIAEREKDSGDFPRNLEFQIVRSSNRKNPKGGRPERVIYMHPILFIDFAMWLNSKFKYDVIKFVRDKMIEYRNDAGDAYNALAKAVESIVGDKMPVYMPKVAEAINYITFNKHYSDIRNDFGTEKEMQSLTDLERRIAFLINDGFLRDYNELITYLRTLWMKKWGPKALK